MFHSTAWLLGLIVAAACGEPQSPAPTTPKWDPVAPVALEGYGRQTMGGQGGTTYHVTNTGGGTSTGSFRWALSLPGPKIIVFEIGGTIDLTGTAALKGSSGSFVTIDGTTAPFPGITIRSPSGGQGDALYIENGAHDIIVKGLRFIGFDADGNGGDLISLYGLPNAVYNVVVDHCTFEQADDGAVDITNSVHDVTVSWNFFHSNHKTQLCAYGARARISIHHNVYASSPAKGERNPKLDGELDDVDVVNNINYGWFWRGTEIRLPTLAEKVHGNIVNNLFTHEQWASIDDALVYGSRPGPDSEDGGPGGTPAQGTVVTTSNLGQLWLAGNIIPPHNRDQYSTITGPRLVPPAARVTTWPASELMTRVLPGVGAPFRTSTELALLEQIGRSPTGASIRAPR